MDYMGQNVLTTWNITGGDRFMNVSLKFNMEDICSSMENTQVTYRKKSLSQVASDSSRFTEWQYYSALTPHYKPVSHLNQDY